jgi:hypothetical protein
LQTEKDRQLRKELNKRTLQLKRLQLKLAAKNQQFQIITGQLRSKSEDNTRSILLKANMFYRKMRVALNEKTDARIKR